MASTVLLERLIVLDRGLTVHDEQADDEELRERVLFVWSAAQEEGPEEKAGRVSSIDDLRRLATVEGCIDFCKTFRPDGPCHLVEQERTVTALRECEPNVWFILEATLSDTKSPAPSPTNGAADDSWHRLAASRHEVSREALQAIVHSLYQSFALFHGSVAGVYARHGGAEPLRALLDARKQLRKGRILVARAGEEDFSPTDAQRKLLASVPVLHDRVTACAAASPARIARAALRSLLLPNLRALDLAAAAHWPAAMDGLTFCPVDRPTYLSVHVLLHALRERWTRIAGIAFLYDCHMLWTDLPAEQAVPLYRFLRAPAFQAAAERAARSEPRFLGAGDGAPVAPLVFVPSAPPLADDPDLDDDEGEAMVGGGEEEEGEEEAGRKRARLGQEPCKRMIVYQYERITLAIMLPPGQATEGEEEGGEEAGPPGHAQAREEERELARGTKAEAQAPSPCAVASPGVHSPRGAVAAALAPFCAELDRWLAHQLHPLHRVIEEHSERVRSASSSFSTPHRFLYCNGFNLAVKAHGLATEARRRAGRRNAAALGPPRCEDIAAAVSDEERRDANAVLARLREMAPRGRGVCLLKTGPQDWVVGRAGGGRHLLLFLHGSKLASAGDAWKQVAKLRRAYFGSVHVE